MYPISTSNGSGRTSGSRVVVRSSVHRWWSSWRRLPIATTTPASTTITLAYSTRRRARDERSPSSASPGQARHRILRLSGSAAEAVHSRAAPQVAGATPRQPKRARQAPRPAAIRPGPRVRAEIGDDRTRAADARALKAYAGSAPVTRASGRNLSITNRRVNNDRLAAAGFVWALVAAAHSPGASTPTTAAASTATDMPPPCATWSTGSSAASTTACTPARHTTKPRRSQHSQQRQNPLPLDS
jgi:predicted membrane-bound mannosyltransferase